MVGSIDFDPYSWDIDGSQTLEQTGMNMFNHKYVHVDMTRYRPSIYIYIYI